MCPPPLERFAVIVLAAGRSRRFGRHNKLLVRLHGQPLLAAAIGAAARSQASPLIVVTGHQRRRVRRALSRRVRAQCVHNRRWRSGMASSLQRGLAAVPPRRSGAVVVLGDMPGVSAAAIDALCRAWRPGDRAVVPVAGGRRGNPVLLHRALFDALGRLQGDRGARPLLAKLDAVREIPGTAASLDDVDDRRQWRGLSRRASRRASSPGA